MARSVDPWFFVLLASACAAKRPPTPSHFDEPERRHYTCDPRVDRNLESRQEPGGVVFELHETTGHCSGKMRTQVRKLGRIIVPADAPSDCPVGALVARYWGHGIETALPSFEPTLEPERISHLRSGLSQFSGNGTAAAYLLGCPKPGYADYVFVEREGRWWLFVDDKLVLEDPRFVPEPAQPW